jgi:hypothetical protein
MYKLLKTNENELGAVFRISDAAAIPFNSSNIDYQTYLKWLDGYEYQFNEETHTMEWVKTSEGNTPLPADE